LKEISYRYKYRAQDWDKDSEKSGLYSHRRVSLRATERNKSATALVAGGKEGSRPKTLRGDPQTAAQTRQQFDRKSHPVKDERDPATAL
jgi:hypothetical protein